MTKKVLSTIADVETAMNELQRIRAELSSKTSEANTEIANIRDNIVTDVAALEEQAKRIETALESWADENRDEYFPVGSKTLDLHAGTLSYRMGSPSLVLAKGKDTEDVLANVREAGGQVARVGIKQPDPTLDKTAIKKLYDQGKISDKELKELGLAIKQEENFLILTNTLEAYA